MVEKVEEEAVAGSRAWLGGQVFSGCHGAVPCSWGGSPSHTELCLPLGTLAATSIRDPHCTAREQDGWWARRRVYILEPSVASARERQKVNLCSVWVGEWRGVGG